jgi:hypothetical protein
VSILIIGVAGLRSIGKFASPKPDLVCFSSKRKPNGKSSAPIAIVFGQNYDRLPLPLLADVVAL